MGENHNNAIRTSEITGMERITTKNGRKNALKNALKWESKANEKASTNETPKPSKPRKIVDNSEV